MGLMNYQYLYKCLVCGKVVPGVASAANDYVVRHGLKLMVQEQGVDLHLHRCEAGRYGILTPVGYEEVPEPPPEFRT